MLRGVEILNDAVQVTMGPAGRLVIFRHFGGVISTKDGVTVAREVQLSDPWEAMGADMAKGAAGQTVDIAGDGTTTAILLTHALFKSGVEAIEAGEDPVHLSRGMIAAMEQIVGKFDPKTKKFTGGYLETLAVAATPEMAYHVAKISANGDEAIAKVVSEAVLAVGPDGAISMANSPTPEHSFEKADGLQLDCDLLSGYFVNDPQRNRVVFDEAMVLILNRRLSTQHEALGIVQTAIDFARDKNHVLNLVVIADDVDKEALGFFVKNRVENNIPVAVIQAPGWGDARRELLDDLRLLIGGERIEKVPGENYKDLLYKQFGRAARVVLYPKKAVFTAREIPTFYKKEVMDPYLAKLRAAAEDTTQHPADVDRLKGRLAALSGGVAVVKVGGSSGDEVKEARFRVEDAIHATRAAMAEGVVPGGGNALLECVSTPIPMTLIENKPPSFLVGINIVLDALEQPYRRILTNAAIPIPDPEGEGFYPINAATGIACEDMIGAGIVDPLKVVRSALMAATAHATLMLKTETIMALEPQAPGSTAGR
jgi:chaperonin GroEL